MLRIGTRGSQLALWQADFVKKELQKKFPELKIQTKIIKTSGDENLIKPLAEIGGKGVFVKEIEDSLLSDQIDIAVHSLKDVPTNLPDGLSISSFLKRHDPRDCLVTRGNVKLEEIDSNSVVGTGSLRRKFQLSEKFPDFDIIPIRGNVDTRLQKLDNGEYDAIILAAAGLKRLNLEDRISEYFDTEFMIPSPCQGIIGVECRNDDNSTKKYIQEINNEITETEAIFERSFLKSLGGDCNIPAGCLAVIDDNKISGNAYFRDISTGNDYRDYISGDKFNSAELGRKLAEIIMNKEL